MLSITVKELPEGFGGVDQKKLAVCREACPDGVQACRFCGCVPSSNWHFVADVNGLPRPAQRSVVAASPVRYSWWLGVISEGDPLSSWSTTPSLAGLPGGGNGSRLSRSALTATRRLEPDMESAAISGRSTSPNAGSKTPAAIGRAMAL